MASIQFYFTGIKFSLTDRRRLKLFLPLILAKNKRQLESLTFVFCSDQYLLDINKQFLHHDYYTDIVTFDLSEVPGYVIGELYISIDRIKENAKLSGVSAVHELHRVIFHGVLHLCGFNDKTALQKKIMRNQEDKYLHQYF